MLFVLVICAIALVVVNERWRGGVPNFCLNWQAGGVLLAAVAFILPIRGVIMPSVALAGLVLSTLIGLTGLSVLAWRKQPHGFTGALLPGLKD